MKTIKSLNQFRTVCHHRTSGSRYHCLSILMALLVFCGANSQLMAALPPLGFNTPAAPSTSGDKFDAAAFLQASAPTAGTNEHWTFMEEMGAGLLGIAAVAGGGIYLAKRAGYLERAPFSGVEEKNENTLMTAEPLEVNREVKEGEDNSKSTWMKSATANFANCKDRIVNSGIALRFQVAESGPKIWNLVSLKDCWPTAATVEKSFLEKSNEVHQTKQQAELQKQLNERTRWQVAQDWFAWKHHTVPDTRTANQKELEKVNHLKDLPIEQVSYNQNRKLEDHQNREEKFAAITVESSLGDMYAALDPEMQSPVIEALGKYANVSKRLQFLYFVVKNHDSLNPGLLSTINSDEALWGDLEKEAADLWIADTEELEAKKNAARQLENLNSGPKTPDKPSNKKSAFSGFLG